MYVQNAFTQSEKQGGVILFSINRIADPVHILIKFVAISKWDGDWQVDFVLMLSSIPRRRSLLRDSLSAGTLCYAPEPVSAKLAGLRGSKPFFSLGLNHCYCLQTQLARTSRERRARPISTLMTGAAPGYRIVFAIATSRTKKAAEHRHGKRRASSNLNCFYLIFLSFYLFIFFFFCAHARFDAPILFLASGSCRLAGWLRACVTCVRLCGSRCKPHCCCSFPFPFPFALTSTRLCSLPLSIHAALPPVQSNAPETHNVHRDSKRWPIASEAIEKAAESIVNILSYTLPFLVPTATWPTSWAHILAVHMRHAPSRNRDQCLDKRSL